LLVAGADLFDPNFRRTVVLVGEHNEEGALGVVLNRPTDLTVMEVVPLLAPFAGKGDRLFTGGPVQPTSAVLLAEFDQPERAGLMVFGSIGFLTGDLDEGSTDGVLRARVFAGYAGWGAEQLEAELAMGSWIVEPARPEDVFAARPEKLWSDVLRRKGSRFALLSTMPDDPSLN
jgi:putative transcriptional regulator